MNRKASGPRSLDGSDVMCRRTPARRVSLPAGGNVIADRVSCPDSERARSRQRRWLCDLCERPETARADVEADPLARDEHTLLGNVRLERAALLCCFALPAATVRVPDVPAEHGGLAANV